jgi:DmsE family decaheme c-type cytochrome
MKQWQKILAVLVASAGLGLLVTASPLASAADAAKPAMAKKADAKDLILKGDAKCTTCHDEADEPKLLSIAVTRHGVKGDSRTPTCVKCHGESDAHTNHKGSDKPPAVDRSFRKNSQTSAADRSGTCLTCHEKDRNRTHWTGSQHDTQDVTCNSCHNVHAKKDKVMNKVTQAEVCYTCHKNERAQSRKVSTHPIEAGKVTCSGCHNLHGSAGPKLVKKNTINETCNTCHAEKRGPYLFEHQPATEDCGACHTPHGSNIAPLLKSRAPSLCDECHDGPHASSGTWGPNVAGKQAGPAVVPSSSYTGRACMNCHVQIHGTNSPAGGYLLR